MITFRNTNAVRRGFMSLALIMSLTNTACAGDKNSAAVTPTPPVQKPIPEDPSGYIDNSVELRKSLAEEVALLDRLEPIKAALEPLETDISAKNADIERLNNELASIGSEISRLQAQIRQDSVTRDRAREDLRLRRQENQNLRNDLRDVESRIERLALDLDMARRNLEQARRTLQQESRPLERLQQELSQANTALNSAERRLTDLRNTIAVLERDIPAQDSKIRAAEQRVSQLKSESGKYENAVADAQSKLSAAEADEAQIESDLKQAIADKDANKIRELREKLAHAKRVTQGAKEHLARMQSARSQHERTLADAERNLDTLVDQRRQMVARLDSAKIELPRAADEVRDRRLAVESLNRRIAEEQRRLEPFRRDLQTAERRYEVVQRDMDLLVSRRDNIRRALADNQNEMQRLENLLARLDQNIQTAQARIQSLIRDESLARQELTTVQALLASLERQAEPLRRQANEIQTRLDSVMMDIEGRQMARKDMIEELKAMDLPVVMTAVLSVEKQSVEVTLVNRSAKLVTATLTATADYAGYVIPGSPKAIKLAVKGSQKVVFDLKAPFTNLVKTEVVLSVAKSVIAVPALLDLNEQSQLPAQ